MEVMWTKPDSAYFSQESNGFVHSSCSINYTEGFRCSSKSHQSYLVRTVWTASCQACLHLFQSTAASVLWKHRNAPREFKNSTAHFIHDVFKKLDKMTKCQGNLWGTKERKRKKGTNAQFKRNIFGFSG